MSIIMSSSSLSSNLYIFYYAYCVIYLSNLSNNYTCLLLTFYTNSNYSYSSSNYFYSSSTYLFNYYVFSIKSNSKSFNFNDNYYMSSSLLFIISFNSYSIFSFCFYNCSLFSSNTTFILFVFIAIYCPP